MSLPRTVWEVGWLRSLCDAWKQRCRALPLCLCRYFFFTRGIPVALCFLIYFVTTFPYLVPAAWPRAALAAAARFHGPPFDPCNTTTAAACVSLSQGG